MQYESLLRKIDAALQSAGTEKSLGALAQSLKDDGVAQDVMYRAFEAQLLRYRDSNQPHTDALANVMDRIAGWCRPELRLFNQKLKS